MAKTIFAPLSDQLLNSVLSFLAEKDNFVFLETSKADQDNYLSYIFTDCLETIHLEKEGSLNNFFSKAEEFLNKGYYLAGWTAYELGYKLEPSLTSLLNDLPLQNLAEFGVFRPPIIFDHRTATFNQDVLPARTVQSKENSPAPYFLGKINPNQNRQDYLTKIGQIKSLIEAGDTYQVNYTLKLLFDFTGDPTSLYKDLRNNQNVSYGAYLKISDQIIQSFSPELFFKKTANNCMVRPMKGTISRGKTNQEDLSRANQLKQDEKNRSENVMIVDLLRNDLGRISEMGSVEMSSIFDIETYRTLHQMTSTIKSRLKETSLKEIFQALFPCGSVTGAPKIRTMEIINNLEAAPRGIYTGGIGFISPEHDMIFNVPIRTVTIDGQQGEMGIGSGIVYDSDPEQEWQECLLKGRFLTSPLPDFQLIETILWTQKDSFCLLDKHMQRLAESARYYQFPFKQKKVLEKLKELETDWRQPPTGDDRKASSQPIDAAKRIRLLLFKDGSFTVSSFECASPKHFDLPLTELPEAPQKIVISSKRTDSNSHHLYHKTTLRELYDQERKTALEHGYYEVLFSNEKNEITEGSITNIIIQKGKSFYTPPISCGLLPGTLRTHLLETHPDLLSEKVLQFEDLLAADNIFLLNSIRGLVKVTFKI